jgi:hypothetical protein
MRFNKGHLIFPALYMLYHPYLPQNEAAKIKSAALELKQKMAALNSAVLPDRLKQ